MHLRLWRRGWHDNASPQQTTRCGIAPSWRKSYSIAWSAVSTVMRPQLERLLELQELDNVELHIMPLSVTVHDGLDGDFMLLNFDNAQSIGYVEYPAGALYMQEQDQVQLYKMAADRLCEAALSESDSAEVIRARISTLTDKE